MYQCDNVPRTDDEYIGEQIYWLMKVGKVKSELGYSELGYNVYQSIYHKLFVYIGYVSCKAFGWSLYSLHLVALLCLIGFLFVFYSWNKRQYPTSNNFRFWGVVILLLFNIELVYASWDFRPEILIMLLGFISYSCLQRYLQTGNKRHFYFASIAAGFCMFSHLNGMIYIVAGFVLLCYQRKFADSLLFILIAAISFLPYFFDVFYNANISYFIFQFSHDPILSAQHSFWYSPFMKLLNEQSRFLFNERQILLTALLTLSIWGTYKVLREKHGILLVYTLTLILTSGLIAPSKSPYFIVLYLPFLYLIIIEAWQILFKESKKKLLLIFQLLLVANISINIFHECKHIAENVKNISNGGLINEHTLIASKIPNALHSTVLCPRIMVFNNLEYFGKLQDIELIGNADFVNRLQHSDIDYVIFSERDVSYFELSSLRIKNKDVLKVIDSTQHYLVAKIVK